ncbi:MAG: carboxylesterase family protein, partial [Planctomycetota bacterium]
DRYTGEQFLTWPEGKVDERTVRVSPTLEFADGYEINHHRVTVNFAGSGSVNLSVAHYKENRLDLAVKESGRHSRFQALESGKEVIVSSPHSAERCAWLIIETTGQVEIADITHTCWRGRGTLYGHSPGVFEFAGAKLQYRLMYPRNYDPQKTYPLVLSVHGSGGVGKDNARSMEKIILGRYLFITYYRDERFECFSLVPQIPSGSVIPKPYHPAGEKGAPEPVFHPDWPAVNENGWYVQATLALIRSLLAGKEINIDPDRVYFTGFSYGGKACWEFLKADRGIFAAAAAGAGWAIGPAGSRPRVLLLRRLKMEAERYKHIPVYIFVGERDSMRFGSRAVHEAITALDGNSNYVEFPGVAHVGAASKGWGQRECTSWLFKQNRQNNDEPGEDPYPGGLYPQVELRAE